ncbi:MAG TPA: zinc ribbon domain-containing protein [Longimicrobium sp.]|nr:zinc ribbon domain-containing protein [Longimicrobium sp.]
MADYHCPDCGAPVSPTAVVCPQCGFPIRPTAIPGQPGRPGGGSGTTAVVIGLVVGGFAVVMFIGFIAALAIPQFSKATQRAKEIEGEALLRWAHTAEQSYFAEHGAYTDREALLTEPKRPPANALQRYTLQISAASDRELCLEAVPKEAGVRAISMDEDGTIYRSAGCSGPPDYPTRTSGAGDEGQRQMLREVHASIVAYRDTHDGKNPAVLPDMITRVHDTEAGARYTLTVRRADEYGVCVAAFPRNPVGGQTVLSVDQDGYIYGDATCHGETVEEPAADSATGSGSGSSPANDAKPAGKP